MARFVEVAKVEEIPSGTTTIVTVEGLRLALVNVGGSFFALDNKCTHRGGPLGEGVRVGEWSLQCPWHGSVFDVRTGEVLEPPAPAAVRSYEVSVEAGVVRVAID
ncbi:MAG TPA: Rieske (2Fe-2S) protein [Acidimicrobiia bacterium]|jgi:nitrite reductase/ring-hydroxylating ferredoxin subunit|nr:Rieske (2Fe-2S) protein [Acidimicrobiia bacterium]